MRDALVKARAAAVWTRDERVKEPAMNVLPNLVMMPPPPCASK